MDVLDTRTGRQQRTIVIYAGTAIERNGHRFQGGSLDCPLVYIYISSAFIKHAN